MTNAKVNGVAKIWVLWDDEWEEQEIIDTIQHLTIQFKLRGSNNVFKVTAMYARCSALERLKVWEDLEELSNRTCCPWLVGGDFNTILDASEKLEGLPVTQNDVADFAQCISSCALYELRFTGSSFTWWNGRIEDAFIFERLDRVFGNNEFMSLLPDSEVHHLIRQGSDHTPL